MFAPHQIVCLDCDHTHLYGEVIQVIEERQLCWLRPMVIVYNGPYLAEHGGCQTVAGETANVQNIEPLTDGPDLLWPVSQFRLALDTDVLPLVVSIERAKTAPLDSRQRAQQLLRQFIEQLWARTSGLE